MACEDYSNISDPLSNLSGNAPIDAVTCPYVADYGAGMGMTVFALFVFGGLGLALTVRSQHPGPLIVVSILGAGLLTPTLPGVAAKILALVLFFALAGVGLIIYQKMQSSL